MNAEFVAFNLDFPSIINLVGTSKQVTVYGWRHCLYSSLNAGFVNIINHQRYNPPILPIELTITPSTLNTLEGRNIERIYSFKTEMKAFWKEGLANIILENYKRTKLNLPLILIIFCVDIEGNPHPFNINEIASLDEEHNKRVTNSELRRCYKLYSKFDIETRTVVQNTLKFVKLAQSNSKCVLIPLTLFWESPHWEQAWRQRKLDKKKTCEAKVLPAWEPLFTAKLEAYRRSLVP